MEGLSRDNLVVTVAKLGPVLSLGGVVPSLVRSLGYFVVGCGYFPVLFVFWFDLICKRIFSSLCIGLYDFIYKTGRKCFGAIFLFTRDYYRDAIPMLSTKQAHIVNLLSNSASKTNLPEV